METTIKRQPLKTYLKLCTEFYDLEKHENDDQELLFYLKKALQANGPILEPMCGTGRFIIPMLQAGLDIEGFDASPHMLDALKKNCETLGIKNPPAWQEFAQDFKSDKRYQLIFVPFGSWGLITNIEDSKKSIANLYEHLKQGGKLILEIETTTSVPTQCGVWRRSVNTRDDGSKIALNHIASYRPETQIFKSHCIYESIVNNKVEKKEEEDFQQYLYRHDELDSILQAANFSVIKKYPAHDPTKPTTKDTPIIIYECVK
jgi:SAM-dependent methyltransferase